MCTQVSKLRMVLGTVPDAFVCPITQEIMKEPTMAADGFSYERVYIAQWLSTANTAALTITIPAASPPTFFPSCPFPLPRLRASCRGMECDRMCVTVPVCWGHVMM